MIGIGTPHFSDVEREKRGPFSRERIFAIADFLDVDPVPLLAAAAYDLGGVRLDIRPEDSGARVRMAIGIALRWSSLSDDQIMRISDAARDQMIV